MLTTKLFLRESYILISTAKRFSFQAENVKNEKMN